MKGSLNRFLGEALNGDRPTALRKLHCLRLNYLRQRKFVEAKLLENFRSNVKQIKGWR